MTNVRKEKKKKNKLYTFLNIVGVLLIVVGLSLGGYTFWQNQQTKNEVDSEISDWENLPVSDGTTGDETASIQEGVDLSGNQKLWGVIEIPSLNVKAPISAVYDWQLLRKYVVPFKEGDLPSVSGGNYSLASHWGNSYCSYCYFRDIKNTEVGAIITVYDRTTVYTYEVYAAPRTITDQDVEILNRIEGQTTLTLITCVTVKDPRRTVVQAKLITSAPRT